MSEKKLFSKEDFISRKDREFSYSKLSTYLQCPQRYKYQYIKGLNRERVVSYLSVGRSLHLTLKDFFRLRGPERTQERLQEIFRKRWIGRGFENNRQEKKWKDKCEKTLKNFFEEDHQNKHPIILEGNFKVNFRNLILKGTIDRVDRSSNGTFEVIDYKSFTSIEEHPPLSRELQSIFYYLGAKRHFDLQEIKITFLYLSSNEKVDATPTFTELKIGLRKIDDIISEIKSTENYPPKKNSFCSDCIFQNRCKLK